MIDIVRTHSVDLIIPVSEEVMHVAQLSGRLPKGTRLLCPPPARLQQLHDKSEIMALVEAAGLTAPKTCLGDDPDCTELMGQAQTVAKPRFGCSGGGLRFLEAGAALDAALKRPDWVIQQRISGEERSTLTFCRDGEVLAHVTYKGLIFSGTVSVCFERVDHPAIEAWTRRFADHTRHTGFIAFDFIEDADGTPWPLECNPRLTSGIHFMDPSDLAAVVTGHALEGPVRVRPQRRFQEGHTALTMAYGRITRPKAFWRALRTVASARDVLWSLSDPFVFPAMTPMSWPVLEQVLFKGRTFGQAATFDIEWTPPLWNGFGDQAGAPSGQPARAEAS
ncbi:MAG: ATP-grasp domain-containing protein [Alphaproteobacteria bacterium]|nr:ATP-grasp domain-containing protein [Alphaproteobacteria bacterium]